MRPAVPWVLNGQCSPFFGYGGACSWGQGVGLWPLLPAPPPGLESRPAPPHSPTPGWRSGGWASVPLTPHMDGQTDGRGRPTATRQGQLRLPRLPGSCQALSRPERVFRAPSKHTCFPRLLNRCSGGASPTAPKRGSSAPSSQCPPPAPAHTHAHARTRTHARACMASVPLQPLTHDCAVTHRHAGRTRPGISLRAPQTAAVPPGPRARLPLLRGTTRSPVAGRAQGLLLWPLLLLLA